MRRKVIAERIICLNDTFLSKSSFWNLAGMWRDEQMFSKSSCKFLLVCGAAPRSTPPRHTAHMHTTRRSPARCRQVSIAPTSTRTNLDNSATVAKIYQTLCMQRYNCINTAKIRPFGTFGPFRSKIYFAMFIWNTICVFLYFALQSVTVGF